MQTSQPSSLTAIARTIRAIDRRTAIGLSIAVFLVPAVFVLLVPHPLEQPFGVDFHLYRDVTNRWLAGGPFFEPYQVTGPYDIRAGDVLYPPVTLWLFVPFAAAAGASAGAGGAALLAAMASAMASVAWWALPLGATAASVWRLRPKPAFWPLIALCLANPTTLLKIWTGNPVTWSMAAMAVATVAGSSRFAAPFVLLKPSLAPFALFGINRRSWWVGLAVLGALCLPFGSLWGDWVASVVNSRGGGLLYSALEIPMLLLPLVAWVGRTRGGSGRSSTRSDLGARRVSGR